MDSVLAKYRSTTHNASGIIIRVSGPRITGEKRYSTTMETRNTDGGNIMVMMPGKRLVVAARGKWSGTRPETNELNIDLKLLSDAAR